METLFSAIDFTICTPREEREKESEGERERKRERVREITTLQFPLSVKPTKEMSGFPSNYLTCCLSFVYLHFMWTLPHTRRYFQFLYACWWNKWSSVPKKKQPGQRQTAECSGNQVREKNVTYWDQTGAEWKQTTVTIEWPSLRQLMQLWQPELLN